MSELRDREQIAADLARYDGVMDSACTDRLIADVGPLLERLDQADADFKDLDHRWSERFRQQTAEIERLTDSLIAEGRALRRSTRRTKLASGRISKLERDLSAAQAKCADWRRLWRDRYRNLWGISEQYRADLAAAQARAEAAEAILDDWERKAGPGSPAEQVFGRQVVSVEFAVETLRSALAGDAARPQPDDCGRKCARCDAKHRETLPWPDRICALFIVCTDCGDKRCPRAAYHGNDCSAALPLPEPEQPPNPGMSSKKLSKRHQPASSFGYAYCAVCRADWPCHAAKEQA